jgi:hypothetical protein
MPTSRKTSPEPGALASAGAVESSVSGSAADGGDGAEIEITGQVERRLLAAGSKSEHQGEVLVTDDGAVWTLRRQGGPAFGDAQLAALDNRRIRASGRARGNLLLMRMWDVVD